MNDFKNIIKKWFDDNADYSHRLNYNLNKDSIVIDLGGYKGWFTEQINNKFGCKIFCFEPVEQYAALIKDKFINFKNILVFPMAISIKNGKDVMSVDGDASSMHIKTDNMIEINCITLDKIMLDYNINQIDLIKINIEGEEYALLEYMVKNKLIKKCINIQIQFHKIKDYETKYKYIKEQLEKTHHLTYNYPFVFENWEKN
jgi:FkbM family methyltransferase